MTKRIAVITGNSNYYPSSPTHEVRTFSWYKFDQALNFRDFDVLILDLNNLKTDNVDWTVFHKLLTPQVTTTILSGGGSAIFVIGDTDFSYPVKIGAIGGNVKFLNWTGASIQTDRSAGNGVVTNAKYKGHLLEDFRKFLDNNYARSISTVQALPALSQKGYALWLENIFETKYRTAICYQIMYFAQNNTLPGVITVFDQMRDTEGEVVEKLLEVFFGAQPKPPEPEWAQKITAPGQAAIDNEIAERTELIKNARQKLDKLKVDREQARKPIRLFFEGGKPLEKTVKEVFADMGGKIEVPKVDNQEEFYLVTTAGRGVTEVKSTANKQVGKQGFQQVIEWRTNGELDGVDLKGILIINASIQIDPDERESPVPSNLISFAEKHDIAVITTAQIYNAYVATRENQLNAEDFWAKLFGTSGLFKD